MREKDVFWGPEKSCFSRITFFSVEIGESGQSKVCSASDEKFFGTNFVGIEGV